MNEINNNPGTNDWKLVNFCEFDKYAVKSYCAIHGVDEELNLGDITKVDENELKPFTMIVGGSPCQDFSLSGKQKGSVWKCNECGEEYNPLTVHWSKRSQCPKCESEDLNKTRSSLLVEWLRVIRANKPNFGIYENVKNIVGKQFKETTFKLFEEELQEYGYNTYWKVLNAKDYGIPQNRERVYLILIKKELDNGRFEFPEGFNNGIRLKDVLDQEVDEKFYLEGKVLNKFKLFNEPKGNDIKTAGSLNPNKKIQDRVRVLASKGMCQCLRATDYKDPVKIVKIDKENIRVRKLIPKECFRLMGFLDADFEKAEKMVSNTQLYKQSGNSIVVDVLYYILVELYKAMPYLFDDLKLSSYFSGIGAFEIALNRLYEGIRTGNFTQPQAG